VSKIIFDSESDGFVDDATQLWCLVTIEEASGVIRKFFDTTLETGLRFLQEAEVIVGHNILKHDIPLFQKLYPWFKPKGTQLDTLILSQLLYPDRVGGHSIEAWGERFNRKKPQHEDWSKFTPEMLHRCVEDTEINKLVLRQLQKDARQMVDGVKVY
jgi:DNA polymerase I